MATYFKFSGHFKKIFWTFLSSRFLKYVTGELSYMIHDERQVGIDEKVQDRNKFLLHHTNGNIYIYLLAS